MKYLRLLIIPIALIVFNTGSVDAQKVYSITSGEMIFSFSDVTLNDDFLATYPQAEIAKTNVRWTIFFHLGQYWHFDFTDNIGLITGFGIRNVGMITDERLPALVAPIGEVYDGDYRNYKVIRRTYALGVPLMLKLGSFKNHIHFSAGAEYELAFHYKEKYWSDSYSRDGSKTKSTEWFGNQIPTFIPSVLGGVQLPGGFNVKFKWYLQNFLDNTYTKTSSSSYPVGDLSRYDKTQVFYLSLSWQFNTAYITKKEWQTDKTVANR